MKDFISQQVYLSYLITDNSWGVRGKDKMELVYMYPLHKPQVLGFLDKADSKDLRGFYEEVAYDDEFRNALVSAVERTASMATHEDDISNLWSVIKRVSSFDRRKALSVAEKLQEKVVNGSITGEKAERFAQHALDEAAEGEEYVSTLSDDDLIGIVEGNQFDDVKKDAFSELLKRDHFFAIHMIEQSPEELLRASVDYLILREIYTQKLLRGDFSLWAEGFTVDDETALKQAEFSIGEACRRKLVFDSENPDFVRTVLDFSDDTFFGAIGDISAAGMILHPSLVTEAQSRLSILLSDIAGVDDTRQQLIYPEKFIKYLCENQPELAQRFWEEGIPVIKKFVEGHGETFYGGVFVKSFAEGFAPLILKDLSRLDEFGSESAEADKEWKEVRSVLFWKMILLEPERGSEFIDRYFTGGYKAKLNGLDGLVSSLSVDFSEQDRNDLLKNTQVQEFLKRLVAGRMVEGSNHVVPFVRGLAQLAGVTELSIDLQEDLRKLDYSLDEAYFINFFLPDLVNHGPEEVQTKLHRFREIKARCRIENAAKAVRFQFEPEKEDAFWSESQVWVATLMEVSPKMLEKIIGEEMGHTHGYYKLQENLKVYARVAYLTQSEQFFKMFYTASNSIAPTKLWDFIVTNYDLKDIPSMTEGEMQGIRDFLDGVGNLNLGKFYEAHRSISAGEIPQSARNLGVTEIGKQGTDQLRESLYATIESLLTDLEFRVDSTNPLQMEILREISRFEVSEWRRGKALEKIVQRVAKAEDKGLLKVPEGYFSTEVLIKKSEVKDNDFEYTTESIARFKELQEDILWASDDSNDTGELMSQSKRELSSVVSVQIEKMERAVEQNSDLSERVEKQIIALRDRINDVDSIRSPEMLIEQAVQVKKSFRRDKSIDRVLRRAVLSRFIGVNKHLQGDLRELAAAAPTYQSMANVAEFSEHNIGEEFIKASFPNKAVKKALIDAFGAKGITEELERYRSYVEYTGQQSFKFVPTRGVLGELSGYLADACWTSKEDIMAQNQNITPVVIVTSLDQPKNMRVGGAFLLLEAQDSSTGESVLIIRGNNPLETVIGKLDPQDYVQQVIIYAKQVAVERGIAKVAIPMDGRGQSATNRQSIMDSYQLLYGSNPRVSLSGNIAFNGYNLSNRCVVV